MAMMISKFHKIIQSKVVWTVFAILISVAFVSVYTGSKTNDAKERSQQASAVAGTMYGKDISRQEFGRAYRNVYVMYTLSMGREIKLNEEVDQIISQAAWLRLVTLKKAEQLGLTASSDQVVAMIQQQAIFRNRQTGQFDKAAYDAFVSGFLPRTGMSAKDFEQMMLENVLVEKATSVAAQGALVTESEIKKAFHLYTDELTVDYTAIPRNLVSAPAVTEESARNYYEQNTEQFRMPEKVMVNYVQFPVADYTAQVTVTDEMVTSYYENNKQRFLKPDSTEAEPQYQPLEEAKETITTGMRMELARQAAMDQADVFVAELADETTTFSAEAEKAGLSVVDNTPAFTLSDRVKGVDPTAPFARAAFGLDKNAIHYYSDPVVGRDFVYVIELHKKFDSFIPQYESVKADVLEAAKLVAAEQAYIEQANSLHSKIKTAVKAGTAFGDILKQHQLELKSTAPFSLVSQLEEEEFGQQISAATIELDEGSLAELIRTSDEYLLAYVSSKKPGDEAELPDMREGLTAAISNQKASRMAAAWQESLLKEAGFKDLRDQAEDDVES